MHAWLEAFVLPEHGLFGQVFVEKVEKERTYRPTNIRLIKQQFVLKLYPGITLFEALMNLSYTVN